MNKTVKRSFGKRKKAIYMGWFWTNSLQASLTFLKRVTCNPQCSNEEIHVSVIFITRLKHAWGELALGKTLFKQVTRFRHVDLNSGSGWRRGEGVLAPEESHFKLETRLKRVGFYILVDFWSLVVFSCTKRGRIRHINHKWHKCIKLELFHR